jgi:hypothetical protein
MIIVQLSIGYWEITICLAAVNQITKCLQSIVLCVEMDKIL